MSSRTTTAPRTTTTPTPASPTMPAIPQEKIAMRAYEKWCQRGCPHGSDQQDWLEAEQELRAENPPTAQKPTQRR